MNISRLFYLFLVLTLAPNFLTKTANAASFLGEIIRKGMPGTENLCPESATNSVCRMTQYQADVFCRTQGVRLPTARELAVDSLRNYPDNLRIDRIRDTGGDGYYLINAIETINRQPSGQTDDFYLNTAGYQRPSGDFGLWFWSSSVPPYTTSGYAYSLHGGSGVVGYGHSGVKNAVRCAGVTKTAE
jgi:hypothetical protein